MPQPTPYHDRVNRALDYVAEHLDGDLSLDTLARIACFSPFHFHRIFASVTGETLAAHVRRIRVERAAQLMRSAPRRRLTDLAFDVGFATPSELSRAFKSQFGQSPSSWDRRSPLEKSKIRTAPEGLSTYSDDELDGWCRDAGVDVRVSRLTACSYAYVRVFAPYGNMRLVEAYNDLRLWLAARGTDVSEIVVVGMSLDDPSITPSENCRYDMGVAFPSADGDGLLEEIVRERGGRPGVATSPDRVECEHRGYTIRRFEPVGTVSIHCQGDLDFVARAWSYLFQRWLPASPFQPADAPAMETFRRLPEEIGWETFDLDVCVPVVEL